MNEDNKKENYELYLKMLSAREYGNLKVMPNQPEDLNLLMRALAKEGDQLLTTKATKAPVATKQSKKLEDALAKTSTNPYIRARIQVLKDLDPDRRKVIEDLERNGKTDNHQYLDFCKMVTSLGDRFSSNNN